MSRTTVTFNGHDLTADYDVSDLRNSLLPRTLETIDVPGRGGALFTGVRMAQRTITLTLTAKGGTIAERQEAARALAGILAVKEPAPLAISIDGGIYYMAVPISEDEGTRYSNALSFEVTFECPDPVAYGAEKTLTVPTTGSLTFEVKGTHATMPEVTCEVTPTAANQTWLLTLGDGTYLSYVVPYGTAGVTYTIKADCERRVLTLDGATKLLVPDADWLVLEPGTHTLTLGGTVPKGAATVKYRERWA